MDAQHYARVRKYQALLDAGLVSQDDFDDLVETSKRATFLLEDPIKFDEYKKRRLEEEPNKQNKKS